MTDFNNIVYDELDRLERIYARALPASSPAFSESGGEGFAGSRGGQNDNALTGSDILAAIGWMERAKPFGGSLLRALFTGDDRAAIEYVQIETLIKMQKSGIKLSVGELRLVSSMMISEHVGAYSAERCPRRKGRGLLQSQALGVRVSLVVALVCVGIA